MSDIIESRIETHVYYDAEANSSYPWFYTVDAYPMNESEPVLIDYGSVDTREQAENIIGYVLSHREEFDNPEYR